ncbi:hypothetical protein J7K55_00400 [Candidatus Aerophobetes bacterium]|nr:hypothetical protein [Candidatus Aerophobetes bacterium]
MRLRRITEELEELSDIEELLLFYHNAMKPGREISKRNNIQERLYQILNLSEFVPKKIG